MAVTALAAVGCGLVAWWRLHWLVLPPGEDRRPRIVVVTGAAGQIGYALAPQVARGAIFGPGERVQLRLMDREEARSSLEGLRLELLDCCHELLTDVTISTDLAEACRGADVAILLAGFMRRAGMQRRDVAAANVAIYREQALTLATHASPDVKVVVVASPANTNAQVVAHCAPSIPAANVTALTRLDHNRAVAHLAERMGVRPSAVRGMVVWGAQAGSQVPDADHGSVAGRPIHHAVQGQEGLDHDYLDHEFVTAVQQRSANIYKLRQLSPALSAATAICDHVASWVCGTPPGEWVSMAVPSDGSYGIAPGLVFSFPVRCASGAWTIVPDLRVTPATWQAMQTAQAELQEEWALAQQCLAEAEAAAAAAAAGPSH